jgi:hypothetical protein
METDRSAAYRRIARYFRKHKQVAASSFVACLALFAYVPFVWHSEPINWLENSLLVITKLTSLDRQSSLFLPSNELDLQSQRHLRGTAFHVNFPNGARLRSERRTLCDSKGLSTSKETPTTQRHHLWAELWHGTEPSQPLNITRKLNIEN